jgi:hypothetical protein
LAILEEINKENTALLEKRTQNYLKKTQELIE